MRKPKIKSQRAWKCLYGKRYSAPKYIVIHFTDEPGGTVQNHLDYFSKNPDSKPRMASAHYFVGKSHIGESVPPKYRANHCGLGGGTFESDHHPMYGIVKNDNSIGIEMCINKHGYVDHGTVVNTRALVLSLMKKYDIPRHRIYRHYDVTGKNCPGCKYIKANNTLSEHTLINEGTWKHFKNLISE